MDLHGLPLGLSGPSRGFAQTFGGVAGGVLRVGGVAKCWVEWRAMAPMREPACTPAAMLERARCGGRSKSNTTPARLLGRDAFCCKCILCLPSLIAGLTAHWQQPYPCLPSAALCFYLLSRCCPWVTPCLDGVTALVWVHWPPQGHRSSPYWHVPGSTWHSCRISYRKCLLLWVSVLVQVECAKNI